ncbi:MAG: hypothetical protein F7B59_02910 [Desulfurococcales archaeon]|nr:hypothetical protein [Desulfurococcales archaeon]
MKNRGIVLAALAVIIVTLGIATYAYADSRISNVNGYLNGTMSDQSHNHERGQRTIHKDMEMQQHNNRQMLRDNHHGSERDMCNGSRYHDMNKMSVGLNKNHNPKIVVSDEFRQNVIGILESNTTTADLINNGYNVTMIKPIIQEVVNGDNTVTLHATGAIVILHDNSGNHQGNVKILIDLENGKVVKLFGNNLEQ